MEQSSRFSPTNPTLSDVLTLFKRQIFLDLFCHHIGIIKSFNQQNQTAKIEIAYKRTAFETTSEGTRKVKFLDYPPIDDCPVIVLGGSTGFINIPIKEGDECFVLFNDVSIDNFLGGNQGAPVDSSRLHSFADAVAIVGLRSESTKLANYQADQLGFVRGDLKLLLDSDSKLNIQKGDGKSLKDILTDIKTITDSLNTVVGKVCDQLKGVPGVTSAQQGAIELIKTTDLKAVADKITDLNNSITGLLS